MATANTFKIAYTAGRSGRVTETEGTLAELIKHYGYTLKCGNSYNSKISLNPRSVKGLVTALNKCVNELQRGSYSPDDYELIEA